MKNKIHKTAIVSDDCNMGDGVTVGPYAHIGPNVELGDGVEIKHHANIEKNTVIGEGCIVYPFASLGTAPQDLKYEGEETLLRIGKNTTVREFCDLNTATGKGNETVIGDNCLLMAYVHVAHNCIVGNNVVMANLAQLAGHVTIYDNVIMGGFTGAHQFCRIGRFSMLGAGALVKRDVVPYALLDGDAKKVRTFNLIGLRRSGFSKKEISTVKDLFRIMFHSDRNTTQAIEFIRGELNTEDKIVSEFINFVEESERGILV